MLRKFLFGIIVALAVLINVAATGTSEQNAIALITIFGLALPFILKLVPAAGHYMVAISLGAALLASIGAELLSGELDLASLQTASVPVLLGSFMSVYGLSQLLYATLTQSPATAGAVSSVPVPAPAPAAP